jgi:peptidoglycan/xylan/chitin deacetylase (PgdA/CDA1 family)
VSALTSLLSLASRAVRGTRTSRLLILIYHRVQAVQDPMFPGEVTADTFDWQMALLRRHCAPVTLADGCALLRDGRLPDRAVAVTFDDGYADNAAIALPILQRHAIPATFFVSPGFLDGGLMWNDAIIESVRRSSCTSLDLRVVGGERTMSLGSQDTRGAVAELIIRSLKHLPQAERGARVSALQQLAGVEAPTDLMMTSEQVRQLAAAGMDIGAHTMTHPILRTLDDAAARNEIERSRHQLERIIGRRVATFAYPNGRPEEDYTQRDRELVAGLGFELAVSTRPGVATRDSDRFQLPRFTPWDQTPGRWLARLLLAYRAPA